ncbi:hypothetical protein Q8F55_006936 [Vanrija albida]|uniref:Peptidase A1 domain-containing protein n=1 Tax=Vanrija albida TaxID=181172 RepID=A0ABR3PYN2_9TREE
MVAVWPATVLVALAACVLAAPAPAPTPALSLPLRPLSQRQHHPDPAVRAAFARDEALYLRLRYSRLSNAERALLGRDVARLARRAPASTPLLDYNFDMGYAVRISVGTPAQSFDVVADTGSHDLVLFDVQCGAQCAGRPVFDHTQSATFHNTRQDIYQAYGTGDASGVFVTDRVEMGGFFVQEQPVALITASTIVQYMGQEISGIMGFSWPSVDKSQSGETFLAPPPMWQTLAANSWTDKQFGMWLGRANVDPTHKANDELLGSAPGMGDLSLGGLNTSLYTGQVTYYDATVEQWWQIALHSYTLNGRETVLGAGAGVLAVIDSGATGIYMPQAYVDAFYAAIPGAVPVTDAKTGRPSGEYAVPCSTKVPVLFRFGGPNQPAWSVSAADLLRSHATSQPDLCFGTVQAGDWLLGAAFMKNVYTAFRYQPPQVGFAALATDYNYVKGKPSGGVGGGGSGKSHAAAAASLPALPAIGVAMLLAWFGVA